MSVVKKIHFIWLTRDNEEIPQYCAAFIQQWKGMYPDFEIRVWTEQDIPMLGDKALSAMWESQDFDLAMVSVRMRFLVVHQNGGIYADVDTQPIKRMDPVLLGGDDFIIGKKSAFNSVDSNLFYAPAGHTVLENILETFDVCTSNKTSAYIHDSPACILYPFDYFQGHSFTSRTYSMHWSHRLGSWTDISKAKTRENKQLPEIQEYNYVS